MPKITIDIPNGDEQRVIDAFCSLHQYKEQINRNEGTMLPPDLVDNPETKNVFIKRKILEYIKNMVLVSEKRQAKKQAEISVDSDLSLS